MDIDGRTFFRLLCDHAQDNNTGPKDSLQLLQSLSSTLENNQLSITEIDDYILHMFDESRGLPFFVAATANKKPYKSSIQTSLDILYTITNNFPEKVQRYVEVLHETCLKVIRSSMAPAEERVRGLVVLMLALEKINKSLELPDHYKDTYTTLLSLVSTKKSDSVQGKILAALGTFAKNCGVIITDEEELKSVLKNQLEYHMAQKDPGYRAVSGAFDGLTEFCEAFPFDSEKDKELVVKLFLYIERMLTPQAHVKVANKAALTYLSGNMKLFIELIVKKYRHWHVSLLNWLNASSVDDQKIGALVLGSFYQAFANYLIQDAENVHLEITMYFLHYFTTIISTRALGSYEKKLALQGLCSFAPVAHLQLSNKELNEIFLTIMQTFEQTYILVDTEDMETLEYLPHYVEAVANFLPLQKITAAELFCLQKGAINMIKMYPKLPYWQQGYVVESLVRTFHALKVNVEQIFNSLVETTVYQGVVWSCSHKHVSQLEMGEEKAITVKSYQSLWSGLLKITPNRKYDKYGIFLYDRRVIVSKIVEKLIRTLLILINKLNVELISNETRGDEPVTDLETRYKVAEMNDFAIYLNVVDLYQDIFHAIDPNLLDKCVGKLIKHLIEKCIKYPYISGFLKLLSFCLEIAEKLNFFEANSNTDCYDSLAKFLEIILAKTPQFKDDLLISCLHVLLHYPIPIIKDMLPALVPAFVTIFHVGKSYIRLAENAIDTLEKWQRHIPNMEDFLIQIVPLLDSYLRSKSNSGFIEFTRQKSRKTARKLAKRRVDLEIEVETVQVQKKILNFIGKQNSKLCEAFVKPNDGKLEVNISGDVPRLKVTLPFDTKIEFYIDKILPRIIQLALESTDRKTRIAACELLHSIVMVFLGNVRPVPDSQKSHYNSVLETMAFPLLQLACDLDQVVRQLFEPLFLQMIHWYTHKLQVGGPHAAIILNAIMSGITHPTDAALRDFSGRCTKEFVKWTIKQSSARDLVQDPINIKALIKKMRYFSLHPDPFKKLGAALIFNSIYRELREESALLSIFWLECLHIFVKSLSLLDNDLEDTTGQLKAALKHLERGFVEKSELFNAKDERRQIPPELQGGLLKDAAVYLLKQTAAANPHCREICMELFANITPHTTDFDGFKELIASCPRFLEEYQPTFLQNTQLSSNEDLLKWLGGFSLCLDGHNFIVSRKLIADYEPNSCLNNSISFFLSNVCSKQMPSSTCTIFQKQQFNKLKSEASLKLLHFLNNCLSNNQKIDQFYNDPLWNFIKTLIFNPIELGFGHLDESRLKYVEILLKKMPKSSELIEVINNYVSSSNFTEFGLNTLVPYKQRSVVKGLLFLQSFNYIDGTPGLTASLLRKFTENLTANDQIYSEDMQDNTLSHCLAIFDYSLKSQSEFEVFTHSLYQNYQVQSLESVKAVKFGTYLMQVFNERIVTKLVDNFELFINISFNQHSDYMEQIVELLCDVLRHLNTTKQLKPVCEYVLKNLLAKWADIEAYFHDQMDLGLDFVKLLIPLMKKTQVPSDRIKRWISFLLTKAEKVDAKIAVFSILIEISTEDDDLQQDLQHFHEACFSESSRIPQDTRLLAAEKLMVLIPNIKCPDILEFLLLIYTELPTENCKTDLQSLLIIYIQNVNENIQAQSLNKVSELLKNDRFTEKQKYKLVINTLALLQNCNLPVFTRFMEGIIGTTLEILGETTDPSNVLQKIVHSMFVEILFVRNPIKSDGETSPITAAAFPAKPANKTLLLTLLKHTLNACKIPGLEWSMRVFRCHSYNATISIISNAMTDANFYNKLFIRQENNKDILWHGLIDPDHKYAFAMDFDTIPKKRKVLINIRDELRARKRLQHHNQSQSVRYVESMRIYNSSLSEDVSKYDFSKSSVRSLDECSNANFEENVQGIIELDCVDVNNHECMASVCGLIEHLVRKGITELPDDPEEDYELPQWMAGIRTLLLDRETHENVKIFWVKVIDNTISVFGKLSKWFLEPLLQFVCDKCAGNTINYFVSDVVAVLASWSSHIVPTSETEKSLASNLLSFLITNLSNLRQDVFKYHLELIKTIVEAWKGSLSIPHEQIFDKLKVDPVSKSVEIGVHVASIFLANKIAPWSNLMEFCKTLCNIFVKNDHRTCYKPCAETIGLVLRLFERNDADYNKVFGNVQKYLKKITDIDKYSYSLEAMVLHHATVADEYHLCRILSKLNAVTPHLRQIYLKIILARSDFLKNIDDFQRIDWNEHLEESVEVQILVLEVIYKNLALLKAGANFPKLIENVCKHVSSANTLIRDRVYDIAMAAVRFESHDICNQILVQGITDSDREIREKVLKFWQVPEKLPRKITKRISYIMRQLYMPNTESEFLGYTSYLLLDLLKLDDRFDRELYENPLEQCDFEELVLHTDWRVRHLSAVPMFASTLASFASNDLDNSATNMHEVRRTQQSFDFAPTQNKFSQLSQFTQSESSLFIRPDDESTFVDPNLVELDEKYRIPKRRFLRDKNKIHREFARREVEKKIKKNVVKQERAAEKENKVTLTRSYRRGDLPDIQITLQALLEPLQNLVLLDEETSKLVFLELFSGISEEMRGDQPFLESISTGICNIFESSTQYNAVLFQALFDLLLINKANIKFGPHLVAKVSQNSGLIASGATLLEEYLISHMGEPPSPKRTTNELSEEAVYWIKVAGLYKELEEWDVVKSVFLEKLDCKDNEQVRQALFVESKKQWKEASELYQVLLKDETIANEKKDFYFESCFKCLAHMGQWDTVVDSIEKRRDRKVVWENLWDGDWNQQTLLPWYMSAQVRSTLFKNEPPQQFLNNLNAILNSDKAERLQNDFAEELTMLWLFLNKTDAAKQTLNVFTENFLSQWQLLGVLNTTLRYNKLLKLRNMIDVDCFIKTCENFGENESEINELVHFYTDTSQESHPNIVLAETRLLYRKQLLNLLKDKADFNIADANVKLDLDLIEEAAAQSNFALMKKYLTEHSNRKLKLPKVNLACAKYLQARAEVTEAAQEKLDHLLKINECTKPILAMVDDSHVKLGAHLENFTASNTMSSILQENPHFLQVKAESLQKITEINTPDDLVKHAAKNLNLYLEKYVGHLDNRMEIDGNVENLSLVAKCHVKLAYHAQKQAFFGDFMLHVFKAMRYNSAEARQLFPCILKKPEFNPEETQQFIQEVETIPVWMFLGWIPQLLATVDSPKVKAVAPILLKIAQKYPQSIMYAYRLSKENYKQVERNPEASKLLENLDNLLLKDQRVDLFLNALRCVSVPYSVLSYYIRKMIRALHAKNQEQYEQIRGKLFADFLNPEADSRDLRNLLGSNFKKLRSFKRKLESAKTSPENTLKEINKEIGGILEKGTDIKLGDLLSNYSPWLASFSADQLDFELEIPGQYDGKRMPLLQHHIKIAGFHNEVSIMRSLRKPIKLTILGSDTKEYSFLVKFGEDIRQDQRIQQLFSLMNQIFTNDNNETITTYQVIPLTTTLGLIQWVDNTTALKQFMEKSVDNAESLKKSMESYYNFVFSNRNPPTTMDAYGRAASKNSREKTVTKFSQLVSNVPPDVLRKSFWKLAVNVESFAALRSDFIKSYATLCICHWILGIGDRHLENSLINRQNGKVMGIDFGHAFGTATSILEVPELVPFRLTPHLINLMEPLGERGLFREVMVKALRSLRTNHECLLATMEVFIQEPSIDWLEHAMRFGEATVDWYPVQKIQQVQRKLQGASSVAVMVEDLASGTRPDTYNQAYMKLVKGSALNYRYSAKNSDLTVEEQVDCLLDHATDYDLLGRMYHGWSAWL